jgi:DNA-binding GntR family transcriptional regulator
MAHEHAALLDALARGDADAAERATTDQVEAARRMVMDGLLSSAWIREVAISLEP